MVPTDRPTDRPTREMTNIMNHVWEFGWSECLWVLPKSDLQKRTDGQRKMLDKGGRVMKLSKVSIGVLTRRFYANLVTVNWQKMPAAVEIRFHFDQIFRGRINLSIGCRWFHARFEINIFELVCSVLKFHSIHFSFAWSIFKFLKVWLSLLSLAPIFRFVSFRWSIGSVSDNDNKTSRKRARASPIERHPTDYMSSPAGRSLYIIWFEVFL